MPLETQNSPADMLQSSDSRFKRSLRIPLLKIMEGTMWLESKRPKPTREPVSGPTYKRSPQLERAIEQHARMQTADKYERIVQKALQEDHKPGELSTSARSLRKQDPVIFEDEAKVFFEYIDHVTTDLTQRGLSEQSAAKEAQTMIKQNPREMIEGAFEWDRARQAEHQLTFQ